MRVSVGTGRHLAARYVWRCAAAALDLARPRRARSEQPPGYYDPNQNHTLLDSRLTYSISVTVVALCLLSDVCRTYNLLGTVVGVADAAEPSDRPSAARSQLTFTFSRVIDAGR